MTTAALGSAARRPFVVAHVAVSLDGATVGFPADIARSNQLVPTWKEDVTLAGADAVLAQESALRAADHPGPAPDGSLLAIVAERAWTAGRCYGQRATGRT